SQARDRVHRIPLRHALRREPRRGFAQQSVNKVHIFGVGQRARGNFAEGRHERASNLPRHPFSDTSISSPTRRPPCPTATFSTRAFFELRVHRGQKARSRTRHVRCSHVSFPPLPQGAARSK